MKGLIFLLLLASAAPRKEPPPPAAVAPGAAAVGSSLGTGVPGGSRGVVTPQPAPVGAILRFSTTTPRIELPLPRRR